MKITFDDKSYLEIRKSDKDDIIIIIISARDSNDYKKKIINSVEITKQQFDELINNLL